MPKSNREPDRGLCVRPSEARRATGHGRGQESNKGKRSALGLIRGARHSAVLSTWLWKGDATKKTATLHRSITMDGHTSEQANASFFRVRDYPTNAVRTYVQFSSRAIHVGGTQRLSPVPSLPALNVSKSNNAQAVGIIFHRKSTFTHILPSVYGDVGLVEMPPSRSDQ